MFRTRILTVYRICWLISNTYYWWMNTSLFIVPFSMKDSK